DPSRVRDPSHLARRLASPLSQLAGRGAGQTVLDAIDEFPLTAARQLAHQFIGYSPKITERPLRWVPAIFTAPLPSAGKGSGERRTRSVMLLRPLVLAASAALAWRAA